MTERTPKSEQPQDMWEDEGELETPEVGAVFPELGNMTPEQLASLNTDEPVSPTQMADGLVFGTPPMLEINRGDIDRPLAAPSPSWRSGSSNAIIQFGDMQKAVQLGPDGVRATLKLLDSYNKEDR